MEVWDREHLSSRNVRELVFEIGELWTALGVPKNPDVQFREVKG